MLRYKNSKKLASIKRRKLLDELSYHLRGIRHSVCRELYAKKKFKCTSRKIPSAINENSGVNWRGGALKKSNATNRGTNELSESVAVKAGWGGGSLSHGGVPI